MAEIQLQNTFDSGSRDEAVDLQCHTVSAQYLTPVIANHGALHTATYLQRRDIFCLLKGRDGKDKGYLI